MTGSLALLCSISVSIVVTSSVDHLLLLSQTGILQCKDRCEQYGACNAFLYSHVDVSCQLMTSTDGATTHDGYMYEYIPRNGTERNILPTARSMIAKNKRISFISNCLGPAMMVGSVVKDEQSGLIKTCTPLGVWTTADRNVSDTKVSMNYRTDSVHFHSYVLTLPSDAMKMENTLPFTCPNGSAAAWDRIVNKAYFICTGGWLKIMNVTGYFGYYGQGISRNYWWLGHVMGECLFYAGGKGDKTAKAGSIYRMSVFTESHKELLSGIDYSTLIALHKALRRIYYRKDDCMGWINFGATESGRERTTKMTWFPELWKPSVYWVIGESIWFPFTETD